MSNTLYIFGAGSLARLAYYYAKWEMNFNISGFVIDSDRKDSDIFCDTPVLNWDEFNSSYNNLSLMYVAVGYSRMKQRESIFNRVIDSGYPLQNIISTSSYVAKSVIMGVNNIIMPGAVIEPGVSIGNNNVFWSNTTICHDTTIGSHNFFASNFTVGGEVTIGDRCFFGFSSTICQQLQIGDDVLLAAKSLLLDDAISLGVYKGTPAKRVKEILQIDGIVI
jgi:sugar O-acyltransferase (sialic acid O-acetyltransferase NeuD family)